MPDAALWATLRKRRIERRLSQATVARLAGINTWYVMRIELGQRNPTISTLARLARALRLRLVLVDDSTDQTVPSATRKD